MVGMQVQAGEERAEGHPVVTASGGEGEGRGRVRRGGGRMRRDLCGSQSKTGSANRNQWGNDHRQESPSVITLADA